MDGIVVMIVNKRGLHARAAAKFVKVVAAHDTQVRVARLTDGPEDAQAVDGASILGLMMLGADPGTKLRIDASGPQADGVLHALLELVSGRFGEPE